MMNIDHTRPHGVNGQSVLRFADIEILRYEVEGFEELPLERKLLVYHLAEATLSGRDILWDQHSRYGLRIRHILEAVYEHYPHSQEGVDSEEWSKLETYIYRVWFASGLHHHYGSDKFVPEFTRGLLERAIGYLQRERMLLLECVGDELADILDEIFDPERSPKLTEQSGDADLIEASSINMYAGGMKQSAVEAFYAEQMAQASDEDRKAPPSYGLNTRLTLTGDGVPYEQIYHSRGLYGSTLDRISTHLKAALAYVDTPAQREALLALVEYYKGGDLRAYNKFCTLWVQDTAVTVDFINGFTETYSDPLGMTGSWEGLVHIRDEKASERTEIICREAQWFERHAPIDDRFRKAEPVGVSASVVTVAMLGGDSYPATPIGINLPNADWIRAEYGSKSVTIHNIHEAYRIASASNGMDAAFIPDESVRAMLSRYEGITEELHTDLHECLGHGSGQLLPGVSPDALGAYGSTIEEARADLFALYYMADARLVELGLLPDAEAYQACYYRYVLAGAVTQLVRIPRGQVLEEAHMRNRALIARYILERGASSGAVELRGIELIVRDYVAMRGYIAELLAEIQRIKSEGDHAAARTLVERYAIDIDPELHDAVLERYAMLDIAPYRGFVNPRLSLVWDALGGISDVAIDYTEGYAEQMLRYSREYATLPLDPTAMEYMRDPRPSEELLSIARDVRAGLRTSMDGVVSSSMREKGLHYGINFGLTLEYIERRASALPQSKALASYFLSRDVRELRLMGMMIFPAEEITFAEATHIASASFSNPELRDCLCKYLMDRIPVAPEWAKAWIVSGDEYADLRAIGYTTLARHLSRGYVVTEAEHRTRLLAAALECLGDVEQELISAEQRSALLMLKRWLRTDREIADQLRKHPVLEGWSVGEAPIQREFAEDIRFELDFE